MRKETLSLRLPEAVLRWLDQVRGRRERSDYVIGVLQERMARAEPQDREDWLAKGRAQYTEGVCQQTLQLNEEFPIADE